MTEMTTRFIDELKKLASNEIWYDQEGVEDLDAYGMSGGNFDNAFSEGERTGKVELAREILSELNINWWE